MNFTEQWFIQNGWQEQAPLEELIKIAEELYQKLGSVKYVEKQLHRDYSQWLEPFELRAEPLPHKEAIQATSDIEFKNLEKVRKKMAEVMSCPVILEGAIMPDACPAGGEYGSIPVGGIAVTTNEVLPAAHSMDICCSLYATFYISDLDIEVELDHLERCTRFGPGMRSDAPYHEVLDEQVWQNEFLKGLQDKAKYHLADQGNGNHFAYLGEAEITKELVKELTKNDPSASTLKNNIGKSLKVLVTHHGSRGLGASVYIRGMAAAVKQTRKKNSEMPEAACWLDLNTATGDAYWEALQYVSRWTLANHQSIHREFLSTIDSKPEWEMGNEHNFVWKHQGKIYHGKGATPAWKDKVGLGLLGLIPLNMAEPILLVRGSANQEYLEFAPHGAGRNLSRNALLKTFNKGGRFNADTALKSIEEATKHISVRWHQGQADVTESPIAYKNAKAVTEQIETFNLAEVLAQISPRGCIMAGRPNKAEEKPLTPKQKRQLQHRKDRRKSKQKDWSYDDI